MEQHSKEKRKDPEILVVNEPSFDEPIVEEIVIQCREEPDLEDIILIDLKDIEKTREELSISEITKENEEREKIRCYICNYSIKGGVYLCPICSAFYCKKCIKSVIERGGKCMKCKKTV